MKEKVVLAYSGGLDTTAIIPWLKENYDCEVICCCIDVGQKEELDGLEERAKACGASKLYIKNVVDEYVENYIMPTVQADAVFEYKYLLGTATARPLIAKVLVDVARQEGATAICHGATGKGNDQIRFELGIKALAPDLKIIAAWRDPKWTMDSRESEIEYCRAHGINLPFSADNSYSRDRNIWHISHEGLELEDPSCAPNYDHLLVLSNSPEKAPEEDVHLSIDWEKGVPVALNGEKMSQREILEKLNEIGKISIISCNYSQYSSRYDAFKRGEILPVFDINQSGGALMDLNVYNIHALIDLFGKPVYHKYMANIERNIDTSGMMIFDFEHFKALCIGAKDCKAPLMNTIQGNLGAIVVKCPLSQMTEYEICYNDGTSEVKSFEKKHRLIYEFKEFMRMMEEKDVKKQKEMLDLSLLISKLMEEGRMQEGIVFDNDK